MDSELGISRMVLYEMWRSNENLYDFILERMNVYTENKQLKMYIKQTILTFCNEIKRRWKESNRTKEVFFKKNSAWLQGEFNLPDKFYDLLRDTPSSSKSGGRPKKSFDESSDKTKARKTKPLLQSHTNAELVFATQVSLRAAGKRDAAQVLKEAAETTPTRATKMKKAHLLPAEKPTMYSPEEALALMIEAKLSVHQYYTIYRTAKIKNCNLYPSYHVLQKAKLECYPPKEAITITDISAEIQLQALLDHTISRIVNLQEAIICQVSGDELLTIVVKWGCDGASGQNPYKQAFDEGSSEDASDTNLFVVSLVPLQLYFEEKKSSKKNIIWQNPRQSSTRFCRPIKLLFEKESTAMSKREIDIIEKQIENLRPTLVDVKGTEICVTQKLVMTMVDGKICNAITDNTSSQTCYICGATPKEMNILENRKEIKDPAFYNFGISSLHGWIRCFECLLHISYRLDIKKWQVQKPDKSKFLEKKLDIQNKFKSRMGLLVDRPKPGGSGNSNDGNTARRFISKPDIPSEITGISEALIRRFDTILRTISCGYAINTLAFDHYTMETAKLYVSLYPWYYMPASVHKILIHGTEIIKNAILPIGQLSEEAQEARNKDCKRYREWHTRKMSRKHTMEDLLHILLVSSDPEISSQKSYQHRSASGGTLPLSVRELLAEPVPISPKHLEYESESESGSESD